MQGAKSFFQQPCTPSVNVSINYIIKFYFKCHKFTVIPCPHPHACGPFIIYFVASLVRKLHEVTFNRVEIFISILRILYQVSRKSVTHTGIASLFEEFHLNAIEGHFTCSPH